MRCAPSGRRPMALLVGLALMGRLALPLPALAQGAASPPAGARGPAPPPPAAGPAVDIRSPSAVLMEAASGQVLLAKNPHERRHPASVTKIMTLAVAYDALREGRVRLTDMVTTSREASRLGGTTAFLEEGETVPLGDLLKAVAVGSANDAAVAVAEHVAGSHQAFVELMNRKARELGMKDTQFQNATGFDAEGHFTTAYDLALLSRYVVQTYPEMLKLTSIFLDAMKHPDGRETELLNRNRLVRFYPGADGLKTGWTGLSGYSIAATARRGGTRMIAVILGAPNAETRQQDAWKLLDYGFAQYTTVELAPAGRRLGEVPVALGTARTVGAVPREPLAVPVPKAQRNQVQLEVHLDPRVRAPVARGAPVGRAVAVLDGRPVAQVDLLAEAPVPRLGLAGAVGRALRALFGLGRSH